MKKIKFKKFTGLAYLAALPLALISLNTSVQAADPAPTENVQSLSKEEFATALASKLKLLKVRTSQLKAMNAIFLQVSGDALEAKKNGNPLTVSKAKELLASYGLTEASNVEKPLDELKDNPHILRHVDHLLTFAKKKEAINMESQFNRLEKEILADLKTAPDMGIDVAMYKADMAEYAKCRFEALMWNAIFSGKKMPRPK